MRLQVFGLLACVATSSTTLGCESDPVDGEEGRGGTASTAGNGSTAGGSNNNCSAALRQALGLKDEVSTGEVIPLETGDELVLYVDASAGGDDNPWVYVSLSAGSAVALTDLQALESQAWDLAFKRFIIRSNGGDSGPGQGGALRVALPWASVDRSTQGNRALPSETWFDEDCSLLTGEMGELSTTFSGWYEYNPADHTLAPVEATYLLQAADGSAYKVELLDYYSNADGTHGRIDGRYKLRAAALR